MPRAVGFVEIFMPICCWHTPLQGTRGLARVLRSAMARPKAWREVVRREAGWELTLSGGETVRGEGLGCEVERDFASGRCKALLLRFERYYSHIIGSSYALLGEAVIV